MIQKIALALLPMLLAAPVDHSGFPSNTPSNIAQEPTTDGAGPGLPEEKPTTDSPHFQRLTKALFQAIANDDPSIALPFFFPLEAYEQVKAIKNPAKDWNRRLVRLFERDIHDYHKQLKRWKDSTPIGISVPTNNIRWMKPGSEGNKKGYYRVLRSQLRWEDRHAAQRAVELTSLISWRGQWYIVHLHGFR